MTAQQRREQIYTQLTTAQAPVSAAALARQYGVSRQIIVGDIALLRASGRHITATPRGYVIPAGGGITVQIACCHTAPETREELYAMVDCGCTVLDVVVEHPVYGQLTGALHLGSRLDVDEFVQRMAGNEPLSALTEGIHLHTLSCPSQAALESLQKRLHQLGFLWEN